MTSVYVDTGIVAKLYCLEATSPEASRLVARYRAPLPYTQFHELELRNALRLKAFRGEISAPELSIALQRWDEDVANGVWRRPAYALADVFVTAETLSAAHTAHTGCRTLDVLHVAAAVVLRAAEFVTWDERQARLAHAAGLRVRQ